MQNALDSRHPFATRRLTPDITLDARRAVWFSETRTLAVADLHLGYAWAHRHGGQLLPVSADSDVLPRLLALLTSYEPEEVVVLGDIVHRAVPVEALKSELCELIGGLSERVARVTLIAGNHDRKLRRLLDDCGLHDVELIREAKAGPHLLAHGDESDPERAAERLREAASRSGRVFIGHEHPAITLSDGVATRAKCACFLASERMVVLPAFSSWAAGSNVRAGRFMSPDAAGENFTAAFAILAGKL